MGAVLDRLAGLGLALPPVVKPLAAYVPALRDGDLVFSSGQVPMADGALVRAGIVGEGPGLVPPADAAALARLCALNAVAAINSVLDSPDDLDRLRILKVVGFVASDPSFTGHPLVINGASELLGALFGDAGVHARSAVGVAALPLGAPVEVEVTARLLG